MDVAVSPNPPVSYRSQLTETLGRPHPNEGEKGRILRTLGKPRLGVAEQSPRKAVFEFDKNRKQKLYAKGPKSRHNETS